MKVGSFAVGLEAEILTGNIGLSNEVDGIYVSDLLSRVMANARKGQAWITVHTHINIIAVALLVEVSCIIIPEGIEVEEATVSRACQECVSILRVCKSAYMVCCIAHELIH